jgi:hypothetical protein
VQAGNVCVRTSIPTHTKERWVVAVFQIQSVLTEWFKTSFFEPTHGSCNEEDRNKALLFLNQVNQRSGILRGS